jgi:dTDP-4-amino-4,6-dideoxygalactose transaminase
MSAFHYQPLNASPMGLRVSPGAPRCPVTEDLSDRLLRLPLFNAMSDAEQDRVIEAALTFRS